MHVSCDGVKSAAIMGADSANGDQGRGAVAYQIAQGFRWGGSQVLRATLSTREILSCLPTFSRSPFGTGDEVNAYLDVIWREPLANDARRIPLATVSRQYALLQHTEITAAFLSALEIATAGASARLNADVVLSEYGERMWCTFTLDEQRFDPGDGHPLFLQIRLQNSVDGSSAFGISVRWFRLVCTNGMGVMVSGDVLRRVHLSSRIKVDEIREFIVRRTAEATRTASTFRKWAGEYPAASDLVDWIVREVAEKWGVQSAARILHICRTGYDGRVERGPAGERLSPDELSVRSETRVPGAPAVARSIYDVYQALTWVAGRRANIEDQESWGNAAIALIKILEESVKQRRVEHGAAP